MTWKAPASSDICYFRIPQPLTLFLPALLEPVTGHVPLGGAPTDFSPAGEPVRPCQLSLASHPLQGGGKRGCRKGASPSPYAEASANPKFPGRDFPQETAQQG